MSLTGTTGRLWRVLFVVTVRVDEIMFSLQGKVFGTPKEFYLQFIKNQFCQPHLCSTHLFNWLIGSSSISSLNVPAPLDISRMEVALSVHCTIVITWRWGLISTYTKAPSQNFKIRILKIKLQASVLLQSLPNDSNVKSSDLCMCLCPSPLTAPRGQSYRVFTLILHASSTY